MGEREYEIHIKGCLNQDWADWLGCMQICCGEDGETILSGILTDQAALLGVLNKMNYLNLCILSVSEKDRKDTGQDTDNEPTSKSEL